jgi:Concanavalin A-like lectin/glucanases superfamily/PEP-CTERM motif
LKLLLVFLMKENGKMEKKIVGIMVCVLAIALIAGVAQAQDITTNLVSHWKLDGTAVDSAGINHGTLVGSPTWVTPGAPGLNPAGAIDFPVAGEEHHVDCGNASSLNLDGSLTVSAWAQVDSWFGDVSWGSIVSKGSVIGSYDLMRNNKTNGIRFGVYANDGTVPYVDGSVDVVSDGLWHLITGVYDSPAGTMSLYIDGELDNSATFAPDLVIGPNDKNVFINGRDGELTIGKRHIDAMVDDVRLYDRALSSTDVQALVPEPATIALLSIGAFGLLRRRRN